MNEKYLRIRFVARCDVAPVPGEEIVKAVVPGGASGLATFTEGTDNSASVVLGGEIAVGFAQVSEVDNALTIDTGFVEAFIEPELKPSNSGSESFADSLRRRRAGHAYRKEPENPLKSDIGFTA